MDGLAFITVTLKVYWPFRGQHWYQGQEILHEGTTVAELTQQLGFKQPQESITAIVDGRHLPRSTALQDGNVVVYVYLFEGG